MGEVISDCEGATGLKRCAEVNIIVGPQNWLTYSLFTSLFSDLQ